MTKCRGVCSVFDQHDPGPEDVDVIGCSTYHNTSIGVSVGLSAAVPRTVAAGSLVLLLLVLLGLTHHRFHMENPTAWLK